MLFRSAATADLALAPPTATEGVARRGQTRDPRAAGLESEAGGACTASITSTSGDGADSSTAAAARSA